MNIVRIEHLLKQRKEYVQRFIALDEQLQHAFVQMVEDDIAGIMRQIDALDEQIFEEVAAAAPELATSVVTTLEETDRRN